MSFLNTIRGLGRSSKKTSKNYEPNGASYPQGPGGSPLRRTQSPTKLSPTKQQRIPNQQYGHQQPSSSPTRRGNNASRLPQRLVASINSRSQPNLAHSQLQRSVQHINPPVEEKLPLFLCEPFVKTALVKGSFKTIVQLPKYVDYGEWIALNLFELFNNLNQFYGLISDYVTPEDFPTMNAGPRTNYLWIDSTGQAVNLPAGQYIDFVLTWISNKLNDQSVFPTKSGGAFPPNFLKDCKNISRQMFRIFAHIYHNHFDKIVHLSLEAHWNSFFAHFISFVKEYNLIDRSELEPLLPLIENLEQQGKII